MILYIAIAALVAAMICLVLLIVLLVRQKGIDVASITDAVADEVTQREAVSLNAVKADLINEGRANRVESNAQGNSRMKKRITSVYLLGYGKLKAVQTPQGLAVTLPAPVNKIAPVLRINK